MQWKRAFAFCAAMFASAAALNAIPSGSAPASGPSILLAQSANVEGNGVSSVSQAFPNPNAAGNLIIAFVRMSTTWQTVEVSDSSGNVYREAVSQIQSDDGHQIHIFYATNVVSGVNTVTATFSELNNHPWLAIFEYSGVALDNPLDVTSGAQGSGTAPITGSPVSTRAPNELVFAAAGLPSSSSTVLSSANGFRMESEDTNTPGSRAGAEDLVNPNSGAVSATFDLTDNANWSAALATFIPAQLTITTSALPPGTLDAPYQTALTAVGGVTPYAWTLTGSLPSGLTLSTAGVISGTPASAGNFDFNAQVTDAQGSVATQPLEIQVNSPQTSPIQMVQSASATAAAVSTMSQSFPNANTTGNLIIAFVRMSTTWQTVQVTDSRGNLYKDAVSQAQSADGHQTHIFYAANIAAGQNTVTASFSDVNNHPWLAIYEYSGLDPVAPLDQTAQAEGASSSATSGATQNTGHTPELLFGGVGLPASSTESVAADTGFTLLQQDAAPDHSRAANEQAIVNSIAPYASSFTLSGAANWTSVLATFMAPAPAHAELTANPASIDFGSMISGTSSTQSITITNTGSASASITQLSGSGTGFSVSGLDVPYELPANASTTFQVTFSPSSEGSYAGVASLISDASNSPLNVSLSGTASKPPQAAISVSPSNVNFGNVNTGSTSTQTLTLTNSGNADAVISQAGLTGNAFSMSSLAMPYTLAAGASVAINVSFSPTAATNYSGTLSITNNGATGTIAVPLSGAGTQPPQGSLAANPSSVSFGNVSSGSTSTQAVTLTNNGNAAVRINQASATGASFSLSPLATPYSLAVGASLTLTISFAPSSETTYSGSIVIASDAAQSPLTIPVSGNGTQPAQGQLSASPASLNFGALSAGAAAVLPVTLTNSGNAPAIITQFAASPSAFAVTAPAVPLTLAAGAAVSVQVKFSPSVSGTYAGTLVVTSNASNPSVSIPLSGSATHSVGLNWIDSDAGIMGYSVYRSMQSGGPYTKLTSSLLSSPTWSDPNVGSGRNYYYVVTATGASGAESAFSSEVVAVIPNP